MIMPIIYNSGNGTHSDKGVFIRTVLLSIFLIMLSGLVAVQATSEIELTGSRVDSDKVSTQETSETEEEPGWIRAIAENDKPRGTRVTKIELTKDGAVNIYKVTYSDGSTMLYDAGTGLGYYRTGSSEEKVIVYEAPPVKDYSVSDDDEKPAPRKEIKKEPKVKPEQKQEVKITEAEEEIIEDELEKEEERLEEELEAYEEDYDDDEEAYEEYLDERERDFDIED